MDPNHLVNKAALMAVAKLAADIATLRKTHLETVEAITLHVPTLRDRKLVGLLSELEQGLAQAQRLALAAKKLEESLNR